MKTGKTTIVWLAAAALAAGGAAAWKILSRPAIAPGKVAAPAQGFRPAHQQPAVREAVDEWYEAVGTVRPRTEARIEAQVTARISRVLVNPGDKVQADQLLVALDDRQMRSRRDQARQGLETAVAGEKQSQQAVLGAEAALAQAEAAFERTRGYFEAEAATSQQLEQAEAAYLQARAGLKRTREEITASRARIRQAEEVLRETRIAMGYAEIRAPAAGEVLKRLVEPGDMALPGKPLLRVQTTGALRLEAYVREGLIRKVAPGDELRVSMETLDRIVDAQIEEIVPYADPRTRTFLVKASLPPMAGLYPGMFGKLLIPVDRQEVILVPREAVRRVGQLELVWVRKEDGWQRRYVRTGKAVGARVEILSGVAEGEVVGYGDAPAAATAS